VKAIGSQRPEFRSGARARGWVTVPQVTTLLRLHILAE
jgi:hypothetical protein